jgi:hypothetical protein
MSGKKLGLVGGSGKNTGLFALDARVHSDGTLLVLELSDGKRDCHIRKEGGLGYITDVFDSSIKDADASHIGAEEFETLDEAITFFCEGVK